VDALLIWRTRINERLDLIEKQMSDVQKFISLMSQPPRSHGNRNYLALLQRYFDEDEIREISFRLQVNHHELAGRSARAQLTSLVQLLEREGRLYHLEDLVRRLRPNVDWPPFV
jgi:hypothetical protein